MGKPWKEFELACARHFGTVRFVANTGGRLDFESDDVIGQCKEVKTMSLSVITDLAAEMAQKGAEKGKKGYLCIKQRRGRGVETPTLIIQAVKIQRREAVTEREA